MKVGLAQIGDLIPETLRAKHRRRPPLSVADWAERFRLVVDGPLVGGSDPVPWSGQVWPPGAALHDAFTAGRWRRVLMVASPQSSGKTSHAINALLYSLHWLNRDVGYVHANAAKAEALYAKKIAPAIAGRRELADLIPRSRDDIGTREAKRFTNGCTFYVTGSESVADLSGWTAPAMFFDDVHAMPPEIGSVGHPVEFAERRAAAYPPAERLMICAGQASDVDSWLWRSMVASSCWTLWLPCPACGRYQMLDWRRMVFDASSVESAAADCRLRCAADCGHKISHDELPGMLERYRWVSMPTELDPANPPAEIPAGSQDYPETARPALDAGFWWSALAWPLVPWSRHAAECVAAAGKPDEQRAFCQHTLAIPYRAPEIDEERLDEAELRNLETPDYVAKTVPQGADLVLVTVDVQSGYVYWLARAWRRSDGATWLVDLGTVGKPLKGASEENRHARRAAGITAGLDAVDEMAREGWPPSLGGDRVGMYAGAIDRGFEADIVSGWWSVKGRGRWYLVRGGHGGGRSSLWPARPRQDSRGRPYREIDVNQAKHLIRKLMRIGPGDPGHWHIPSDGLHANTLRAYYRHLASERFRRDVRTPRWEKIEPGMANHFWDCEVYQVCLAVAAGVQFQVQSGGQKQPVPPVNQPVDPPPERRRASPTRPPAPRRPATRRRY